MKGDGRAYAIVNDSDVMLTSSNGASHDFDKEHVKMDCASYHEGLPNGGPKTRR
jgi:hypothetical protein